MQKHELHELRARLWEAKMHNFKIGAAEGHVAALEALAGPMPGDSSVDHLIALVDAALASDGKPKAKAAPAPKEEPKPEPKKEEPKKEAAKPAPAPKPEAKPEAKKAEEPKSDDDDLMNF